MAPVFSQSEGSSTVRAMDILTEVLYPALEEAKATLAAAQAIDPRPDAVLFGDGGFDSMGLVQFIVIVEEHIEDRMGQTVRLATDRAMSRRRSPFATLEALAEFVRECVDESAP